MDCQYDFIITFHGISRLEIIQALNGMPRCSYACHYRNTELGIWEPGEFREASQVSRALARSKASIYVSQEMAARVIHLFEKRLLLRPKIQYAATKHGIDYTDTTGRRVVVYQIKKGRPPRSLGQGVEGRWFQSPVMP